MADFTEALQRMLAEAADEQLLKSAKFFTAPMPDLPPLTAEDLTAEDLTLVFKRFSYTLPVSSEMAMDHGLIPDTRPPVKIGWRVRLGWWWEAHRPHLHLGPCPRGEES